MRRVLTNNTFCLSFSDSLAIAASSLAPGSFSELVTGNFSIVSSGTSIFAFADSAAWDPISKQFLFVGSYHQSPYRFVIYRSSDNTWRMGPALQGIPFETLLVGHAYDHNTV